MVDLVTRAEWGAREPRDVNRISTPTRHLVLHYFDADWPGPEGTRRAQDLHMGKGWHDIAYSLTADSEAIYMARGPGVQGAHTPQWNTRAHAVAAQVTDGEQPDGLLDRLAGAAVWLYEQGAVMEAKYTGGHRDYSSTACPGNWLYARIPEINTRAAALLEDDMALSDEDVERVAKAIWTFDLPHARTDDKLPAWRYFIRAIAAGTVDVQALAEALAEELPEGYDPDAVARRVAARFAALLSDG